MRTNNGESLHFAMYSWLAMGHLTTFLHLANRLAQKGHKISFFLPRKTQSKLASHNHHPNLITFIPFDVPHVDGLPVGAETTNDVPAAARLNLLDAMDLTQDIIDSHLAQLKPDFILYDFADWIPDLARKHGVKSIYNITSYMVIMGYFNYKARNVPVTHNPTEAELISPPPNFPCMDIRMRAHEARGLALLGSMKFPPGKSLKERQVKCYKKCDAVAAKTCREIEEAYIDFAKKHMDKPIFLVGPLLPEPPTSELDYHFESWLSGFDRGSVVYCALGSEAILEKDQFQELVLGLELTGRPFLAALRPPRGVETVEQGLPEGYLERIKGRGIVHGGWVQQPLILNHPSVGCFITHCGAGSLSEALLSKCQLVLLPQAVDQFLNARLMSLDLKAGVEVENGEDDGLLTREAVRNAVAKVMEPESDLGREVRANHAKLRELLSRPGFEDYYIESFVQNLRDLLA